MFKVEFSEYVAGFDQNGFHHHLENTVGQDIFGDLEVDKLLYFLSK